MLVRYRNYLAGLILALIVAGCATDHSDQIPGMEKLDPIQEFTVRRLTDNYAELLHRRPKEKTILYEIKSDSRSETRLAVVRKAISIIREKENGNFSWVSRREKRIVMLSARVEDNAILEEFLMREFF